MFYQSQARSRKSVQRKSKIRRRKRTSIIPALVIESLAVVAILILFFGVRADLNNQTRMKNQWDVIDDYPREVSRQDRRVGLLAQPMLSAAYEDGLEWSCN